MHVPSDVVPFNIANELKSHSVLQNNISRDKVLETKLSNQNQSTSIGASTRNIINNASFDRNLAETGKTNTIHNINGSFLHFNTEKGGKILDLSKKVLKSPRNLVVGETTPGELALSYKVPWNNSSV